MDAIVIKMQINNVTKHILLHRNNKQKLFLQTCTLKLSTQLKKEVSRLQVLSYALGLVE